VHGSVPTLPMPDMEFSGGFRHPIPVNALHGRVSID
jgi:hypothetical protein